MNKDNVELQCNELLALKENWNGGQDGVRAEKVSIEAISTAKAVIFNYFYFLPDPHLSPLTDGGVQIEWETRDSQRYFEIVFDKDNTMHVLLYREERDGAKYCHTADCVLYIFEELNFLSLMAEKLFSQTD